MPSLYAHDPFLAMHRALQAPWLDGPMRALSFACLGGVVAIVGLIVFALIERHPRKLLIVFLPLVAGLLAGGFLSYVLKEIFYTPRPLQVLGEGQVRVLGEKLYLAGFPSGHATSAAVLASYVGWAYGRRWSWFWALPVLGGLSRIYVGAHWATDVVGGWVLGAVIGTGVYFACCALWPRGYLAQRRNARFGQTQLASQATIQGSSNVPPARHP
jgi:membrane-associated phospholipid phosphatase